MGRLLGHGRYAWGTYPENGSGGGAGAASVPLSRQRFIDGDTTQLGLNGAAAEPFKTIAQFMAELPGDTMLISKTDTGANAVAVQNNAAATIGTIPANSRGFVLARFNGTDWVFSEGGSLAA